MAKQVLGISVTGRDVKIACLVKDKNRISVTFLEESAFAADLENEVPDVSERETDAQMEEEQDLFSYEESNEPEHETNTAEMQENANMLHGMLRKFTNKRIKASINLPSTQVSYQDLNTTLDYDKNVFKGNLLKKIEQWKSGFNSMDNVSVVARADGTLCNVALESSKPPVILNLMEHINTFFKGNLIVDSMTPNEIALVNLAKKSYEFKDENEVTAIIQIEEEFSRIVFMKGKDFLAVSPIISETNLEDVNRIIYSKILYELDNQNISHLSKILLASKATAESTKKYFEAKFKDSRVGYIISQPLAEMLSNQFSREILSEHAIPISLAWQTLKQGHDSFHVVNLLPKTLIDRQKVLKLSLSGYVIFVLLAIGTFFFTYQNMAMRNNINKMLEKNQQYEEQILNNQEAVARVEKLDKHIKNLTQSIALSDSLGSGFDDLLNFLENMNRCVLETKHVWIDEIQKTEEGYLIRGNADKRANIPKLSNALGETILRKVIRKEKGFTNLYRFEIEVTWPKSDQEIEIKQPGDKVHFAQNKKIDSNKNPQTIEQTNVSLTVHRNPDIVENGITRDNDPNRFDTNDSTKDDLDQPYETASINAVGKRRQNDYYTIRMQAFSDPDSAFETSRAYRADDYQTFVTTFDNPNQYWVCLGRFLKEESANTLLAKLKQKRPGEYDIAFHDSAGTINTPKDSLGEPAYAQKSPQKERVAEDTVSASQPVPTPVVKSTAPPVEKQSEPTFSATDLANTKKLTIRISAHFVKISANREAELYNSNGYKPFVVKILDSNHDIPYWVCIGNFHSYGEAQTKLQELDKTLHRNYEIIALNNYQLSM